MHKDEVSTVFYMPPCTEEYKHKPNIKRI